MKRFLTLCALLTGGVWAQSFNGIISITAVNPSTIAAGTTASVVVNLPVTYFEATRSCDANTWLVSLKPWNAPSRRRSSDPTGPSTNTILTNPAYTARVTTNDPAFFLTISGVAASTAANLVASGDNYIEALIDYVGDCATPPILVYDSTGQFVTTSTFVKVTPQTPTLTLVTPASILSGSGNAAITVSGTQFYTNSDLIVTRPDGTEFVVARTNPGSATAITATLTGANLAQKGTYQIRVRSLEPSPFASPNGNANNTYDNSYVPAYKISNAGTFTVAGPELQTVTPSTVSAGSADTAMTLLGTGFTSGANARVIWTGTGGVTEITPSAVTSTTVNFTAAATLLATAGTATVAFRSQSGEVTNALNVSIQSGIGTLSPSGVPVGSPSIALTVTGSGFQPTSVVTWTDLTRNNVDLVSSYVSANQMTALVPAAYLTSPGTAFVRVRTDSAFSLALPFVIGSAPTLSSLSPSSISAGSAQFNLTATGTGFATDSVVQWIAGGVTQTLPTTFISTTQLAAVVPAALVATQGTATLRVAQFSGVSSTLPFNIVGTPPPVIDRLLPDRVSPGAATFALTLEGTGFVNGSIVQWTPATGGAPISLTTAFVDATRLTAIVPDSRVTAPGVALVTVLNPGGAVSLPRSFTIAAASTPTLSSASPPQASTGSASLPVVLTGTGFTSDAVVQWSFGGTITQLTVTPPVTATQLTVTVPAALLLTAGTARITVVQPGGTSNGLNFNVVGPAPAISSVDPTRASPGGPTFTLTVNGSGFLSGSVVQWNTGAGPVALSTGFVSDSRLTAVVTADRIAAAGAALITVLNPGGAVSAPVSFTIGAPTPAVISAITPAQVPAGSPNTPVSITGSGFAQDATVQWTVGGVVTTLPVTPPITTTQINVTIPSTLLALAGTARITVVQSTGTSNAVDYRIVGTAPTITSLDPNRVSPGSPSFTMTITGSGFVNGAVVVWNAGGAPLQLVTGFVSDTRLNALVPAERVATAGSALISVTNPGGAESSPISFTISATASLSISSVNPSLATAGATAPLTITITGTGFASDAQVLWDAGGVVTPLAVTPPVTPTQIVATIPVGLLASPGVARLSVSQSTGASNVVDYRIVGDAPVISSLDPNRVAPGNPTFTLTINGTGFANGATVQWNAGGAPVQLVTGFVSTDRLTAVVPADRVAVAGAALISVTNPGGAVSAPVSFTIGSAPPPAVTIVSPNSAAAGSGQTQLTVVGTGFDRSAQVRWTTQTGTQSLTTGFVSPTQLTALVPATLLMSPATTLVSVANSDGSASNTLQFAIVPDAVPSINSLVPEKATAGGPAFQLRVIGTNLVAGSNVNWLGAAGATSLAATVPGTGELSVLVPASLIANSGVALVTVTSPGGRVSNSIPFPVESATQAKPAIAASGLTPASATAGDSAFVLAVTGTGFASGAQVIWTTQSARTTLTTGFTSATQLTALVPSDLLRVSGSALVSVVNPDGGTSNTAIFPVNPGTAPVITTLTPTSLIVGQAGQFTIRGSGFVSGSVAQWNAGTSTISLTTGFVSSSELTVVVPSNLLTASGSLLINVLNPGGALSNSLPLTLVSTGPPPTLTTLSQTSLNAGSPSVQLTVSGTNFVSGSQVQWTTITSSATLTTGFVSSTQLTALVPASLLDRPVTALLAVVNPGGAVSNSLNLTVSAGQAPEIQALQPTNATAGGPAFQLTVTGSRFVQGSAVQWAGTGGTVTLTTGLVSERVLSAVVPANLILNVGSALVSVINPGGSVSNSVPFSIASVTGVTPRLDTLDQTTVNAGSGAFTLTLTGQDFVNGSVVNWNDGVRTQALATGFVSGTRLTALIPAGLVANAGVVLVAVANPGGASSNSLTITIVNAVSAPTISATNGLDPAKATAGTGSFQLTLNGTGFANGAVVQWNSGAGPQNLVTGFVNSSRLTALIPATLIQTAGTVFVSVLNPGGLVSNSVSFVVETPSTESPTISSLNPAQLPATSPNQQMTVRGTNFINGATVQWNSGNGFQPLQTGFVSETELTALLPSSLLGTQGVAFVRVQNPGGTTSNSQPFTIVAATGNTPTINATGGLSPSTATVGSGAFQLQINGSNFVSGSIVQWNAGSGAQALTTGFVTSAQLTALVPANLLLQPGRVFVTVQNPGGVVSNTASFEVTGSAPLITGLSQTTVPAGLGAFQLTVNGQNFGAGATVRWGTTNLPTTTAGAALVAAVPADLTSRPGTVDITVQSPAGISNALPIVIAGPTANLLSPQSAPAGSAALILTVSGTNFVTGTQIVFGSTPLNTLVPSSTQLTATLDAGLLANAGAINVIVQNPGGSQSAPLVFTVGAPPGVQGVVPNAAPAGSPALTITISGTNFTAGSTVQWNGVPLQTTFVNATQLTARVPTELLATAGTVNITVFGSAVSQPLQFTIGAPAITAMTPSTAPAGSTALQLQVTGTNFLSGSTVVWNSTTLPTSSAATGQLTAVVDASLLTTAGVALIAVVNPGGSRSERSTFTIEAPTLTTLTPNTVQAGGQGLTMTVTGTGFVTGANVLWNGTVLPTTFASSTQLTAQVSANLVATQGTATVTVRNPGGTQTSSLPFNITTPPAATLTGLNPPNAVAGASAFQLTVVGTGFVSGSVVQWNGTAVPTSFINATQLAAVIDSPLIVGAGTANVSVQNPQAPVSTSLRFTINGPAITSISPTTIPAAAPQFTLTVTGVNFLPGSTIQWNGANLPTAFSSSTQLSAPVPQSLIGTAGNVSVTVQNPGGSVSPAVTFVIGPFTLAIQTSSLADGIVGQGYSQLLQATGGSPPYTWALAGGNLPDGVTLEPATGRIAGTPLTLGISNVSVAVTDSVGRTVSRALTLRTVSALTITTPQALPAVVVNTPFSVVLAAAGGTPPYIWTFPGQLPPGLSLNTTTGELSGTPSAAGTYRFTVAAGDSRQQTAFRDFTLLVVPPVQGFTVGGLSETMQPNLTPRLDINIGQPYPVELTGTMTLAFSSEVGGDDTAVAFSTGGRRVVFTIPAGATTAVFGEAEELLIGTGTLAGTITLRTTLSAANLNVTPLPAPVRTVRIQRLAPVLTSVTLVRGETGMIVTMTGFSTTREVQRGTFRFNPAAGSAVTGSEITSQLANLFSQWYTSQPAAGLGSQFRLSIPFNVAGRLDAIGSVTVTLTNAQGASQPVTAEVQ